MLEEFKNEIPNLEKLKTEISSWLSSKSDDLEDLRELVCDYIIEEKGFDSEDDKEEIYEEIYEDIYDEAFSTSYDVVDSIIYELEVNEINFRRLKNYIKAIDSYIAYHMLIEYFAKFMTKVEKQNLIKEGKKIFEKELTEHWED